jgi:hypothetical protein
LSAFRTSWIVDHPARLTFTNPLDTADFTHIVVIENQGTVLARSIGPASTAGLEVCVRVHAVREGARGGRGGGGGGGGGVAAKRGLRGKLTISFRSTFFWHPDG